jgi:hypothetical protein
VQRRAAGLRTPARWATITIKDEHTGPKHGNETSTWHIRGALLIAYRTQQLRHNSMSVLCQFQLRAILPPPRAVVYERFVTATCRMSQKRIGYVDGGGGFFVQRPHLTLDRRKRGRFNRGMEW